MSSKIRDLHDEAMDQSFFAMRAKSRGDSEESKRLFADALDKELAVLKELDALDEIVQPTHAILHRSAATLALHCGNTDLAEKLAAKGLAQGPHREFAEELIDVMEQANHARHLETTGVELVDNEMQLSLSGRGVGYGLMNVSELLDRVGDIQRFFERMVEWKLNKPYRSSGNTPKDVREALPVFMSAPRPGSFAVTLRLGENTQMSFLETLKPDEFIEDFLDIVELIHDSDQSDIEEQIPDVEYRNRFIELTQNISPDGERISQVGFTSKKSGSERRVSITKHKSDLPNTTRSKQPPVKDKETINLIGELRFADAATETRGNTIKIVDAGEEAHKVVVSPEKMNDIVDSWWGKNVVVSATRSGRRLELVHIEASADDS